MNSFIVVLALSLMTSTHAVLQGTKQKVLGIDCSVNGLVPDPSDCQQYFSCWAQNAYGPIRCSDGLLFNAGIQQCDWAANVQGCGPAPAPTAKPTTAAPAPTAKPTTAAPAPTAKPTTAAPAPTAKPTTAAPAPTAKPTTAAPAPTAKPTTAAPAPTAKPTTAAPAPTAKPTTAAPAPTAKPTTAAPVPVENSLCKIFGDYFASIGVDPDADIFGNTDLLKWSDVCFVADRWNEMYPNDQFLVESPMNNNLLTLAAFFGNAHHESAKYTSCSEKIQPCIDWYCSSGWAHDYRDENWGTCYQAPIVGDGSFINWAVLPTNACESSPTCTSHDGTQYSGVDCWYGRGMLQLTWNCNYAKVQRLLEPLNLGFDICQDPDSICHNGGVHYFAPSLGYWMMNANKPFKIDHGIETAMNCIKAGCDQPFKGTWLGPGHEERRAEFRRIAAVLHAEII